MAEYGDALPHKLPLLLVALLAATNLVVFSVKLASADSFTGPDSFESQVKQNVVQVGDGFTQFGQSISHFGDEVGHGAAHFGKSITYLGQDIVGLEHGATGVMRTTVNMQARAFRFAVSFADVKTFIKPAAATMRDAPTIIPVPAAPTPPAAAAAPAQPVAKIQPVAAPPAPAAPVVASPVNTTNSYAWGNCTWWVAIRRSQNNDPVPNTWGNATTWAERAARDGYVVDHNPTPGSIMQISGGLGHVAFVESVNPDGTWNISEMNVVGLDVVDHKAKPPSAAANYYFIHDQN